MTTDVISSPPDASTGCASVVEDTDAGCVQAASTPIRPTTVREFERALRGIGYSQREAAAIARSGFKAITSAADEQNDIDLLVAALRGASTRK